MIVAVVGHVEWVEFARVERVPHPGEIVHAFESWSGAGGGGAVAAVELQKLTGSAVFFTALGDDDLGRLVGEELAATGLRVEVAWRAQTTRRGFVHIDAGGERTITVVGDRLGPHGDDGLPWEVLGDAAGAYFTAGDAAALRRARAAGALVATSRALPVLAEAGIELDALVHSSADPSEAYGGEITPPPRAIVATEGKRGGVVTTGTGAPRRFRAAPLPGPVVDRYGAGDSFAAGLTYGLAAGMDVLAATAVGAERGAAAVTRRGPYGGVGT